MLSQEEAKSDMNPIPEISSLFDSSTKHFFLNYSKYNREQPKEFQPWRLLPKFTFYTLFLFTFCTIVMQ